MLFAKQTGISSKPSAGERLRANLYGEDEEAKAFCRATEEAGLSVDVKGTRHKKHIACVSTALNAYRVLGKELYVEALSIIAEAWNGKPDSLRYEIVKAITEFVQFYNGKQLKRISDKFDCCTLDTANEIRNRSNRNCINESRQSDCRLFT